MKHFTDAVQSLAQLHFLNNSRHGNEISFKFFTSDISQAYVQSETSTQRPIFVRPPTTLNIRPDVLLQVRNLFIGIPRAGLHWYQPNQNHHNGKQSLTSAVYEFFFLITKSVISICKWYYVLPRECACLLTDKMQAAEMTHFHQASRK